MFCPNPVVNNRTIPFFGPNKECYVDSLNIVLNFLFLMMTLIVVMGYKCMKTEKKTLELVRYHEHASRWILTLVLLCINLIECGEGIMANLLNEFVRVHIVMSPLCSLLSTIAAILFYQFIERLNRPKTLLLLFLFWPVAATLKLAKLVTLYGMGYTIYHLRLAISWAGVVIYCLLTAIDATLLIIQVRIFFIFSVISMFLKSLMLSFFFN